MNQLMMLDLSLLVMMFIFNLNNTLKIRNMSTKLKPKKRLKKLEKDAEGEKYLSELQDQLEALSSKMEDSKNNDIERFKSEISELIEMEIVTRYFYQKGKIETTIKHDEEIAKAIEVLDNIELYDAILRGDSIKMKPKGIALITLAFFAPISIFLTDLAVFSLAILWLFDGQFMSKWNKIKSSPWMLSLLALLFFML